MKDSYNVLGLECTATPDVVKRTYRQLAMKFHPDRNFGNVVESAERFKEIAAAYNAIMNSSNWIGTEDDFEESPMDTDMTEERKRRRNVSMN